MLKHPKKTLRAPKLFFEKKQKGISNTDNSTDQELSKELASTEETKTGPNMQETPSYHEKHHVAGRVHTGIPGLDDVMGGGFRHNTVNLVGGGAGAGKSIFCMQYLIEGIRQHNENGIYLSFEESSDKIKGDMKSLGWDIEKLENENKLTILYYSPEQVQKLIESGGGIVRDLIEQTKAKRIVVDSLTAFTLLHETELAKRKSVLHLFDMIYKLNVTAVLTGEHEPDPEKHKSNIVEFEVDSVILLYNLRKGDVRERSLEVFKMRGSRHSNKIFPMKIEDNGVSIFPEETVF